MTLLVGVRYSALGHAEQHFLSWGNHIGGRRGAVPVAATLLRSLILPTYKPQFPSPTSLQRHPFIKPNPLQVPGLSC